MEESTGGEGGALLDTGKINIGFEPFIALFAHHFFFLLTPSVCRSLQTVSRKNARLLSKPFFLSLSPSLFLAFTRSVLEWS